MQLYQLVLCNSQEICSKRHIIRESSLSNFYRATNGDINSDTDSSEDEDSEDEKSDSSDYETECYEAYTRKNEQLN